LGLWDWREDVYSLGLHADNLQNKYLDVEIGVSLPRIQPEAGGYKPKYHVSDRELVQALTALRIFLPRAGITISTRENAGLRNNLVGLGVTRMSAGSHTEVGGYSLSDKTSGQFCISDTRSVSEIKELIYSKGYQPVFKDWGKI
jgi:2-iminoacetate synthase